MGQIRARRKATNSPSPNESARPSLCNSGQHQNGFEVWPLLECQVRKKFSWIWARSGKRNFVFRLWFVSSWHRWWPGSRHDFRQTFGFNLGTLGPTLFLQGDPERDGTNLIYHAFDWWRQVDDVQLAAQLGDGECQETFSMQHEICYLCWWMNLGCSLAVFHLLFVSFISFLFHSHGVWSFTNSASVQLHEWHRLFRGAHFQVICCVANTVLCRSDRVNDLISRVRCSCKEHNMVIQQGSQCLAVVSPSSPTCSRAQHFTHQPASDAVSSGRVHVFQRIVSFRFVSHGPRSRFVYLTADSLQRSPGCDSCLWHVDTLVSLFRGSFRLVPRTLWRWTRKHSMHILMLFRRGVASTVGRAWRNRFVFGWKWVAVLLSAERGARCSEVGQVVAIDKQSPGGPGDNISQLKLLAVLFFESMWSRRGVVKVMAFIIFRGHVCGSLHVGQQLVIFDGDFNDGVWAVFLWPNDEASKTVLLSVLQVVRVIARWSKWWTVRDMIAFLASSNKTPLSAGCGDLDTSLHRDPVWSCAWTQCPYLGLFRCRSLSILVICESGCCWLCCVSCWLWWLQSIFSFQIVSHRVRGSKMRRRRLRRRGFLSKPLRVKRSKICFPFF